jgi:hypothetical protein
MKIIICNQHGNNLTDIQKLNKWRHGLINLAENNIESIMKNPIFEGNEEMKNY